MVYILHGTSEQAMTAFFEHPASVFRDVAARFTELVQDTPLE